MYVYFLFCNRVTTTVRQERNYIKNKKTSALLNGSPLFNINLAGTRRFDRVG